jgi:uncharacterized membrane protein YkoI
MNRGSGFGYYRWQRLPPGLLLWCVAVFVAIADNTPKKIQLSQAPVTVQQTIRTQLQDAKLGEIEQTEEYGDTVYIITMACKDGEERDFTVASDGTLLSLELPLAQTPLAVQAGIKAQLGQSILELIERTWESGKLIYEIEATRKNGAELSFTISEEGKLISLQVTLEETPASVRNTIQSRLDQARLEGVYRIFEDGEISYYVEISRGAKLRSFSVAADGKLESAQVFLSETSAAAQKTIRERIGEGTLVRIDEVFEKRNGVFPFEVEARKNGKPFNFSVGPRGRFLGMD